MDIKELHSFKLSDAIKFHDKLNPKLWLGDRLDPAVRKQLLVIAKDFMSELGIDDLVVDDVTISGSNAAYSYTPHSDLDLHILVDMSKLPDDEVYSELFNAKKILYNDSHDITIKGVPVELYVQDSNQPVVSLGEYSLLDNKWIKYPSKRRANLDQSATKAKFNKMAEMIDMALKTQNLERVEKVIKTIKRYRQAGLDKGGEFSPENLAYKVARKQGAIQQLYDLRDKLHSEQLSIDEMYSGPKMKFLRPGELRGSYSDYDLLRMGFKKSQNGSWYIPQVKWEQLRKNNQIGETLDPMSGYQGPARWRNEEGRYTKIIKLPDGRPLEIGVDYEKPYALVNFYVDDSQRVTGGGDAYRIFATVGKEINDFMGKYKPDILAFTSSMSDESRIKLYDRIADKIVTSLPNFKDYTNISDEEELYGGLLDFADERHDIQEQILYVFASPKYMKQFDGELSEAFDQPYKLKWEKGDYGDVDALAKMPDGNYLSIMFNKGYNQDNEEAWNVEFYRNNSQEITGEGDAQRVFATVLFAIDKFIKKYKPNRIIFAAVKDVEPGQSAESRVKLYDRLVQRYSNGVGYRTFRADTGNKVIYELSRINKKVTEESKNLLDKPELSIEQLSKKHKVSVDQIKSQLAKGIKVELEHTSKHSVAKEIALDHLAEDPKYYDKLAKVELEEASGYIPSEKQKNDPRWKTALTVDVKPDSIKKNAKAFSWLTDRAGIPPTAKPNGKI